MSLHHEAFHQQFQVCHRTAAQLTTFSCQRATVDKIPNKTDISNLTWYTTHLPGLSGTNYLEFSTSMICATAT